MKHLILAVAFIAATFSSAFADNRLTENASAIKAGRVALSARISQLENGINSHNTQAAQTAATEVLVLMRKGMALTYDKMNLGPKEKQKEINKHYLEMEKLTHEYNIMSQDLGKNGKKMLSHAQNFMKEY
jgi:hypothetical protein